MLTLVGAAAAVGIVLIFGLMYLRAPPSEERVERGAKSSGGTAADRLAAQELGLQIDWRQFDGLPNTEEVLVAKARALCPKLGSLAIFHSLFLVETVEAKAERAPTLSPGFFGTTFVDELLSFYVHIVCRSACSALGEAHFMPFAGALIGELPNHVPRSTESLSPTEAHRAFVEQAMDFWRSRDAEYARLRVNAPDEGRAGDLFYEYGHNLARTLGYSKATASVGTMMAVIMYSNHLANRALVVLELAKLLGGPLPSAGPPS